MTTKRVSILCAELRHIIDQTCLSQNQFESIYLRLSASERRLYSVINEYEEVKSSEIRFFASVGNISQVADRINKKLLADGDPRQLVAERRTVVDAYGLSSFESFWSIKPTGKS